MKHVYDVIVVGAGAAGIACAEKLNEQAVDFQLLEARSRVGGRVHSLLEPGFTTPIELGAEFIHGVPQNLLDWMQRLQLPFYDAQDEHLFLKNKKLTNFANFFEKLEKLIKRIDPKAKTDLSVHEFIHRQKRLDPEMKAIFKSFVEGFHAADLNLIGVKGLLATQEADDESLNGSQMFRPLMRYDLLLSKMTESFLLPNRLHLQTELKKIDWEKGHVRLTCEQGPTHLQKIFECRKLVLTLPLGVLKSEAIHWNRKPKSLDHCLEHLQMGHVQRIVFRFRQRFWEGLSENPVSFLHSGPENYFPTWWTLQPLRTPHLVAWQGGPKALEMSHWSDDERIYAALKTLSQLTGQTLAFVNSQVEAWHFHNWSEDPWARGAYSYISMNGMKAAERFRRPFENTIYFAGEAAAVGAERGTVHGALATGSKLGNRLGLNGNF